MRFISETSIVQKTQTFSLCFLKGSQSIIKLIPDHNNANESDNDGDNSNITDVTVIN